MKSRCGAPSISGSPAKAGKITQAPVVSRKPWRSLSVTAPLCEQASATEAPTSMASTDESAKASAFGFPFASSRKNGTSMSPPSPRMSQPMM